MKRILILSILLFSVFLGNAQSFNEYTKKWATYFGGQGTRFTNSFVDSKGDLIAIGEITGPTIQVLNDEVYYNQFSTSSDTNFLYNNSLVTPSYSNQTLIAKFNMDGELIKSVYLPFYTMVAKIDSDDNIYIAGSTTLSNIGTSNVWQTNPLPEFLNQTNKEIMVKLNDDFSINWLTYVPSGVINEFCFDENFNIYGITNTKIQSGIITPNTFQPNFILETNGQSYYDNGYLFKINNQGELQWATYYGLTFGNAIAYSNGELITSFSRSATSLTQYDDYYYTSNAFSQNPSSCIIAKFNANNGQRIYSTYLDNVGISRITHHDNYLYFYGYGGEILVDELISNNAYQTNFSGAIDLYLGKFDQNINPIWGTYIGGTDMELINEHNNIFINEKAIYLIGQSTSDFDLNLPNPYQNNNGGMSDLLMMKFDLNGQFIWGTYFGGTDEELYGSVAPINDSTFYIVGNTKSSQSISTQGSYQETLSSSPSYPSSNPENGFIAKFASEIELSVSEMDQNIYAIYPNPTNGIVYFSDNLKAKVYNTLGQLIITNDYSYQLDITSQTKGVYFVTLTNKTGHSNQIKIVKE